MPKSIFDFGPEASEVRNALAWARMNFVVNSLKGQSICVTGEHSMSRNDMHTVIGLLGGYWQGAVTSGTTMLLIPDENYTSTKVDKARKLRVPIMTEDQFCKMILGMQ